MLPGVYTIVLKIGKKEYRQSQEVLRDPNTAGSDVEIREQFVFGEQIYRSIQSCLRMIDTLEILRSRADSIKISLLDKKQKKKLLTWQQQLYEVEGLLHDVHQTGARQDIFRNPAQLLERFLTISKESISGGSDFKPTDQHREVYGILSDRLSTARTKYESTLKSFPEPKPAGGLPGQKLDTRTNKN